MLFVDDYSRMMTIMFFKQKSDAFQMFKWYLARVEKEIGKSMKGLRSDRGGEFTSNEFEIFCYDYRTYGYFVTSPSKKEASGNAQKGAHVEVGIARHKRNLFRCIQSAYAR